MGTIGAIKAFEILKNSRRVIAMEMMCACQAIDLGTKNRLGNATQEAYNIIREKVATLEYDREIYEDINNIENLIIEEKLDKIIKAL